ncbi:MAG: hypothetical protein EP297_15505 [Gammaproteobacteria bacterium]|nr:MAG: hypothetical protein EP297_15505 [Gammaproteobacteria bacterium]
MIQGVNIFIYPTLTSTYYAENSVYTLTLGVMKILHPVLVTLAYVGVIVTFMSEKKSGMNKLALSLAQVLAMTYLYFILIHIIVAPFPRYAIPIRPITYILAFIALNAIIHHITYFLKRNNPAKTL